MEKLNKTRIGSLITVRTGSTRLEAKCLQRINGREVIRYVVDRAKLAEYPHVVVICTTNEPRDDILERIAKEEGVRCFRGSVKDKLVRWLGAAKKFRLDYVVNIDADDPFCDPSLVDAACKQILKDPHDMIKPPPGIACGAFTGCVSVPALKKVCEIKDTDDTEFMWEYFTDTGLFKTQALKLDPIFLNPKVRLTLDYPEDLQFFEEVFKRMKMKNNHTPLKDILEFLSKNPAVANINFFRHNEFVKNQKNKTFLKLKSMDNTKEA